MLIELLVKDEYFFSLIWERCGIAPNIWAKIISVMVILGCLWSLLTSCIHCDWHKANKCNRGYCFKCLALIQCCTSTWILPLQQLSYKKCELLQSYMTLNCKHMFSSEGTSETFGICRYKCKWDTITSCM